jgi:hypothetical protein
MFTGVLIWREENSLNDRNFIFGLRHYYMGQAECPAGATEKDFASACSLL